MNALSGLDEFVEEARRRVASAHPDDLVELMQAAANERSLQWASAASGSELMLHRASDLTIFVLAGRPRTACPPHEHTMKATIAVLAGEETNVFYQALEGGDPIEEVGRTALRAGDVLALEADVIHSVQYRTVAPTVGLHVYHGDLLAATRRLWNQGHNTVCAYDQSAYEEMTVALPT